jgi:regulator of protease activity HflC (stomatin/prohibitin superfamily)
VLDPRELKDEGLHLIWPWNELFMYDLRLQSITETYNAISSDGVSLTASVNARFRLQRDGVAILHKAIGPNFLQLIAQPGIGSLTREVIAHYTAEQVYSSARQEIQDKIRQRTLEKASEKRMGPVALSDLFILYDTLLYGIELPPFVVNAINRKTEQYYISEEYTFRVEREKRESERKRIEAEGMRFSADRQPGDFRLLSAMARHRRDAATCAVHKFEDRDHRERQGWLAHHLRQPAGGAVAPAGAVTIRTWRAARGNDGPGMAVGQCRFAAASGRKSARWRLGNAVRYFPN